MALEPSREVELARRLLAGGKGAFEDFVDVFQKKVFQYTWLMCGQREDAEEVAQETLLKVFQNFGQLREPEHVKTWVFRIARNECYMKRRKSIFAPAGELSLDEIKPSWRQDGSGRKLDIADWSALPDAQAASSQMSSQVRAAIQALPEHYRSVILLRDVEEMSTAEAAQILEISEELVKTRLHRARLAVRQQLDRFLRKIERVA